MPTFAAYALVFLSSYFLITQNVGYEQGGILVIGDKCMYRQKWETFLRGINVCQLRTLQVLKNYFFYGKTQ